jgi:3-oxoacyl-[acyl-carrier protein] reductase
MRLEGKRAIITGGASGFGAGIAEKFVQEGATVAIADINREGAHAKAATLAADRQGCAIGLSVDVADGGSVDDMIDRAEKEIGPVDILVNNAGASHKNQPMLAVSEQAFDRIYAVNVKSLFLTARKIVPLWRARGGGVMLTIASTAGVRPRPGLSWYNGSKGAAITLTKSMAIELAPENIRVNALNPVMGETALLETFMGVKDTPENRERFIATIPMGRFSRPRDVANAAVYLCSDEADFITGVALEIDGGRSV